MHDCWVVPGWVCGSFAARVPRVGFLLVGERLLLRVGEHLNVIQRLHFAAATDHEIALHRVFTAVRVGLVEERVVTRFAAKEIDAAAEARARSGP